MVKVHLKLISRKWAGKLHLQERGQQWYKADQKQCLFACVDKNYYCFYKAYLKLLWLKKVGIYNNWISCKKKKKFCQRWDSNPRPHTWTRIPILTMVSKVWPWVWRLRPLGHPDRCSGLATNHLLYMYLMVYHHVHCKIMQHSYVGNCGSQCGQTT